MGSETLKDTPLYNSRILDSYLKIVQHKYPHLNIAELLEYAGMKKYEVEDQAHWFSQEQVDRFYEKLVQMTGNQNLAREAGRYAASPDALGAMRQYVLGLIGASNTFEKINKITANFTRSSIYRSRKLSSRKVEITVVPIEQGLEKKFQCDNRIGFFEAVILAFSKAIPIIDHPECMFAGGKLCRYVISWEHTPTEWLRRIALAGLLIIALGNLALLLGGRWDVAKELLAVSLGGGLLLTLAAEKSRHQDLITSLNHTRESNDNLIELINVNYNNALMAYEIGRALGSDTSVGRMLPDVALIMQKRLEYDRGLIMVADREKGVLKLSGSYGYAEPEMACLMDSSFPLSDPESENAYLSAFRQQRPFLIEDLNSLGEAVAPPTLACTTSGPHSFICCPIMAEGVSLGVLAVENLNRKKPLVESDISLIMGTASMIGISIRNCELIADLKRAKEELELRVAKRTEDLEKSRVSLVLKNQELERTYRELEEETAKRLQALERLRENERMLIQQSRQAALGEMISNIAHQWRQPLNELGLIVQELPMMYDRQGFTKEYLKKRVAKFMTLLSQLSNTIDDFRTFFARDREKVTFCLKEVVNRSLSMILDSFKQLEISISVQGGEDLCIEGYPNEFSQVLLNILFNARDAFLERDIRPREIEIAYFREGGRTVLTVVDNAGGIAPEIIDKIFDPYFTTRGPERGTGIGLYMSKTIIEKNLQGRLTVRNLAQGAEFRIEV